MKSAKKIKFATKAARIASRVMDSLLLNIRPGKTEKEISSFIKKQIKKFGGQRESFKIIVASGKRSSMIHGYATKNIIRKKSIVLVDLGVYYRGFCSDISRTFYLDHNGKCRLASSSPEPFRRAYQAVRTAQGKGINIIKSGLPVSRIDIEIRKVLKKSGMEKYFIHSAGHGIGKKVHEKPRVHKSSREILKEGDIITVEPGVYFNKRKKRFGIRIEDVVLVKKKGCKILTDAKK